MRLPLRAIPGNAVVRILQGRLRGAKWVVNSGPHGYWLGSYESAKQRALAQRVLPGWTAFDVGAHAGFYSLLLSRLAGPTGRVIAFEPESGNFGRLRRHIALNGCTNVTPVPAAAADFLGTSSFDLGPSSSMGRLSPLGKVTTTAWYPRPFTADSRCDGRAWWGAGCRTPSEQVEEAKAKFLRGIVNRVDVQRNPYYYSHYYRKSYTSYYKSEEGS